MRRLLAGVVVGLLSNQALAQETRVLSCTGPFAKAADEAALVKAFGRANVVEADLDGAEGQTEKGTVLFPKDASRRVEIFWWDTKRKRRPASIRVQDRSAWTAKGGASGTPPLRLGAALADIETANGRSFALSGFGWDYGGFSNDWKGGALDKMEGGCSLSVRFSPDPKAKSALVDKVSGDRALRSDQPAVRAVKPTVSSITLGWPE